MRGTIKLDLGVWCILGCSEFQFAVEKVIFCNSVIKKLDLGLCSHMVSSEFEFTVRYMTFGSSVVKESFNLTTVV